MSADVVCMGLGPVPAGEQRCRFLAVGLSDDTVRIISLDPNVGIFYSIGKKDYPICRLYGIFVNAYLKHPDSCNKKCSIIQLMPFLKH